VSLNSGRSVITSVVAAVSTVGPFVSPHAWGIGFGLVAGVVQCLALRARAAKR
jgi:hypothetical protein